MKTATADLHLSVRDVGERGAQLFMLVCRHHVAHSIRWPDLLDRGETVRLLLFKHLLESKGCGCTVLCTGCRMCDGYAS